MAGFVGQWKVTWQGKKQALEAQLELTEKGGSWRTLARNRFNPCIGLEAPVEFVEAPTPTRLVLNLKFSVVQGCKDARVVLDRNDSGVVTGARGDTALTLQKR